MSQPKKRYQFADLVIKALTLILAIIIFVDGTKTLREQYKSKYWDHQLKVYSRLLNATAVLSMAELNSDAFQEAKTEFLSIYYGEANLVATKRVEAKIIAIKNKLDDMESRSHLGTMYQTDIRQLSIDLSKECRNSTLDSWKIKMRRLKK